MLGDSGMNSLTCKKPRVVFFIRHLNDFNYSEKLIKNVSDSIIIYYGPKKYEKIIRKKITGLAVDYYSASRYHDDVIVIIDRLCNLLYTFFLYFRVKKKSHSWEICGVSFYDHIVSKRVELILKQNLTIFINVNCYAFDHTVSRVATKLIAILHKIKLPDIPVVALPHGANIFDNVMLDIIDKSPRPSIDYTIYDIVVCNDDGHEKTILGNKVLIPCLKYTNPEKSHDISYVESRPKKYSKILVLHTKFVGNIFRDEFLRCLIILGSFKELSITIRPHPKGIKEVKCFEGSCFKISKEEVMLEEDINAADVVIVFGTSAVFDAFLMKKPVLFPRYVTSNQIKESVLNECNVANSPDEFYELIKSITNGFQPKIPRWSFPERKKLENMWKVFLTSPTGFKDS